MKGRYKRPSELLLEQRKTGKSYWDLIGRPLYDEGKDEQLEFKPATDNLILALQYLMSLNIDSYDEGKDALVPETIPQNAPLSYSDYYGITGDLGIDAGYQVNAQPINKYKEGKSAFLESLDGRNRQIVDDTIDYFLTAGLDPMLVSGIIGNMALESRFDPNAVSGQFRGLAQMSNNMRKEVQRVYGDTDWKNMNLFIYDAMSGNEKISKAWRSYMKDYGGYYGNTYASPAIAALAFEKVFERANPKLVNLAERQRSATEAYDYILKRQQLQQYDMHRATELGYERDDIGHLPSRDYETGRILKAPTHPTFLRAVSEDFNQGYLPRTENGLTYTNRLPGFLFVYDMINAVQNELLQKPQFVTVE